MRRVITRSRRILAAALCTAMLVSLVPWSAFALDEDPNAGTAPQTTEAATTDAPATDTPTTDAPATDTPTTDAPATDTPATDTPATDTPATRAFDTHIATYVGQVPAGIEWADGVTADTFATAFSTVTAKAADGTQYTVEVVPSDLIYFVDSVDATMGTAATTEAYAAIQSLLRASLRNDKADQFKTADTAWGLGETDANTKGTTDTTVLQKDYTGIYGQNGAGNALTYQFALEAGVYTVSSFHYEWWAKNSGATRPMTVAAYDAEGTQLGETVSIPNMSKDETKQVSVSFTLTEPTTVSYTVTATGTDASVISWVAVQRTGDAPELPEEPEEPAVPTQPTLPAGFGNALEESDGLTYASGAVTSLVSGCDTVFTNNTQWNNTSGYHASINDAQELFGKTAFTVLFDIKPYENGDGGVSDKRVALTIGTSANVLRVPTWSGKIGYGKSNGGESASYAPLTGYKANEWNAVALVYQEADGANGSAKVYINGELAGEVADVGFKLSEMGSISAMLARTFDTSYMQQGDYDNIVVGSVALDEDTAKAETAWRKYQKDNLPEVNTAGLEAAVEEAQALVDGGLTSDRLTAALSVGKDLLGRTDLTAANQADIDAALSELSAAIGEIRPTEITISGADVEAAAQNINGLTWKGWGMLNGNSTSNLLMDYKAEHPDAYWEMMEYLFGGEHPLFTHIKMEMGNDGNNSTGAEACTMRSADDEADASRSPGFAMAADAKAINPDVKISVLRWEYPSWIADTGFTDRDSSNQSGWEEMYIWYRETIFDAYEKYGYVVDFVNPDRNETSDPNEGFIKWFENRIVAETEFPSYFTQEAIDAYHSIRIIASDENKGLQIVPSMRADEELYDAVDIIGFHYRTNATEDYVRMADVDDKEVWYSEGCATFGYSELQENKNAEYGYETIGGYQSPLALADSIPNAFVASRRSHYVFQPAIGSFYEGIQYGHKELLSARDPWSGYIHYDPALQMLAHFSRFAVTGWEDSDPSQNEIWRMIANASYGSFGGSDNEHQTAGINGDASYLTLAAPDKTDFSVVFVNNTRNQKTFRITAEGMAVNANELQIWVTETDSYLQKGDSVTKVDDSWIVRIPAYSVVTATTLNEYEAGDALAMPSTGINTAERTVLDTDATGHTADTSDTYLYADDFEYDEYGEIDISNIVKGDYTTDYLTSRGNEPRYMLDTHGAWVVEDGRLTQALDRSVGQWNGGDPATIVGDFRWMNYMTTIDVQIPNADASVWAGLGIRSQTGMNWNQDGYTLRIYGDGNWAFYRGGTSLASGKVETDATGSYQLTVAANGSEIVALIDGEAVYSYSDSNPMDAGRVKLSSSWSKVYFDNLEVTTIPGTIPYATSMIDGQDDAVEYTGTWSITQPGGGSADNWYRTLSTTSTADSAFSFAFPVEGTGFAIVGPNDGSAVLDVEVDGQTVATDAATGSSGTRFETYTYTGLDYGFHTVKVTVKSGKLVIDALYTLGQQLEAEDGVFVSVETALPEIAAAYVGADIDALNLPEKVNVKTAGGDTVECDVTWAAHLDTAYQSGSIQGTVSGGVTALGIPLTVSIPIGEVVPEGLVYFIDTVTADPSQVATTEPYEAVKSLVGNKLLNDKNDQFKEDGNTWGLVDRDAGTKEYSSTADKMNTGIYAAQNSSGETLSYDLTLDPGVYTLTSGHHEWWSADRPMTATLETADGTLEAGSFNINGSNRDYINTYTFAISTRQTVRYTLTANAANAPVISWLAVAELTDTSALRAQLATAIDDIESAVEADLANGVNYAETPLEPGQTTGIGAVIPQDSLQDLNAALDDANAVLKNASATGIEIYSAISTIETIYENLRVLPEEYDSIPGTAGDVIYADTGLPMQAHGGSAIAMVEGTGDGQVNIDLDGDGAITPGKTVYLWYGEDKTNSTRPVDGVRCYVSTDLYNWTDRGAVLYTQDTILPIEESNDKAIATSNVGSDGEGAVQSYNAMQVSETNLNTMKEWGKLSAPPTGVSQEDFDEVKLFLRAYVTEFEVEPTGLYDTAWVARTYDETPIETSSFLYPDSTTQGTQQTTRLQLAFEALYGGYCITERPKMIYNETTEQFVIVFHADGPLYNNEDLNTWVANGCEGNCPASRYSRAMVGFAVSDTPFGPFELVNVTRMNYNDTYSDRLGEARDMTVFVDEGVDSNGDGVDDAYVIYSSEMNAKLYISLLNAGYTGPITTGSDGEDNTWAARIVDDNSREAPAVFKYDGWYYLITSGTDGWNSTAHVYYRSQNLMSGWENMGNPALNDTGKCFNTQVTYVLPIDAEAGQFIYMSDRWNGSNLTDSRTIWLPLQVNDDHTIAIRGESYWTLDRLAELAPVTLNTELPDVVWADGSNLPDVVNVTKAGQTFDARAEWTVDNLGDTTVTLKLPDLGVEKTVSAFVVPSDLLYFANPTKEPASADYNAILAASAGTLLSKAPDGAYSAENGYGYVGEAGSIRENNADIYQSLRYAAANADSIAYEFDLPAGEYEVYIGMYDPSGWGSYNPGRKADISINDTVVETGYSYYNNCLATADTLHYTATVGDDGKLNVTIAPNSGTDSAVQVSFIMVAGKPAETFTVSFETNGAGLIASQRIAANGLVTEPATPVKDGYDFDGWYTDATCTAAYDFSAPVTKSFTLYAKWTAKLQKVEITDLTELPTELEGTFESLEAMQDVMLKVAADELKVDNTGDVTAVWYDVELLVSFDGGATWTEATKENFPAEGIVVNFAYPEGTNNDDYQFAILHMTDSGATETFSGTQIAHTATGMSVRVMSLSPFAVTYRERDLAPETPVTPETPAQTPSASTGTSSQTGDPAANMLLPAAVLLVVCAAGIAVILLRRRRT